MVVDLPVKVIVPTLLVIPGGTAGYFIYESYGVSSEILDLIELGNRFGGCEFWFIKSTNDHKGWYKEEAVLDDELRKATVNSEQVDKIVKFIEQMNNDDDTDTKKIIEECKKKPERIVEVAWSNNKWQYRNWNNDPHKRHNAT